MQEKLSLMNPTMGELLVSYMGPKDLSGSTQSEHLFFLHFPLLILTDSNGI